MTPDPNAQPSTADLLRMLQAREVDTVPAGWHRAADIRRAAGVSAGHMNKLISRMRETGMILDQRLYKVAHPSRGPTPVPHYLLAPEALRLLRLTE